MRTLVLAAVLAASAGLVQAQSPAARLPNQAELPAAVTPSAGYDEAAARRRLEDAGYRDLRNITSNGDGTFSARGSRRGALEVNIEIDAMGNVRER
jgi:hypothetical protein